jgi:hypothetical protein
MDVASAAVTAGEIPIPKKSFNSLQVFSSY